MRILVISDLPQFVTGGAEMQAARLIQAWLDAGHEVVCMGRRMDDTHVTLGRHTIAVHRIRVVSWLGRPVRALTYLVSLAGLLLRYRRWAEVIYTRFLGEGAVTAAGLRQLRLIDARLVATPANTHGSGDVSFLRSVPFSGWLVKLLDRQCDAINLIAEAMAPELAAAGFSGRNFTRIPNGIPVRPVPTRSASGPLRFVAVGRLSPQKGYDLLLRALALVREQLLPGQIRIIGSGPEHDRLVEMTRALQLSEQVQWLGELPQAEITLELERAQLFLLPSRYEGLSNAGLEAMERSMPLLLTRCGGLDRYVTEDVGWTVPPDDVVALAGALTMANAAPVDMLAKMGGRAREVVEREFDMAIIASRYLNLFGDISDSPARANQGSS